MENLAPLTSSTKLGGEGAPTHLPRSGEGGGGESFFRVAAHFHKCGGGGGHKTMNALQLHDPELRLLLPKKDKMFEFELHIRNEQHIPVLTIVKELITAHTH